MKKSKQARKNQNSHSKPKFLPTGNYRQDVSAMFRTSIKYIRKSNPNVPNITKKCDLLEPWLSRRITATVNYLPFMEDHYQEKYQAINIRKYLAYTASAPTPSYNIEEQRSYLTTAAALWILDKICENEKYLEASELLNIGFEYNDFLMANIHDPSYTNQILSAAVYVIQHRNDGINKYDWTPDSTLIDEASTIKSEFRECEAHNRFSTLLNFISSEKIDLAITHFKDKVYEWMHIYFHHAEKYISETMQIESEISKINKKIESFNKETRLNKKMSGKNISLAPLMVQPNTISIPSTIFPSYISIPPDSTTVQREQLIKKRHEIDTQFRAFQMMASNCRFTTYEEIEKRFGKEIADDLFNFQIDDPYEICFALLYLLDNGDDLPWLYYFPTAVVTVAASMLPWTKVAYEEDEEPTWERNEFKKSEECYSINPELYSPKYKISSKLEFGYPTSDQISLAQIVYKLTGSVLPRHTRTYTFEKKVLQDHGVSQDQSERLLFGLSILEEIQRSMRMFSLKDLEDKGTPEEKKNIKKVSIPNEQDDKIDKEIQIQSLLNEISNLKVKLKEYQETTYSLHREASRNSQKYADLKKSVEQDRRELSKLREIVFNISEGTYENEISDANIDFPYNTNKHTIVFGGHDSWLREIKSKLPNVKFMGPNAPSSAETIRNMDVVWLQTNCLGHSDFYKITNICRSYGIPYEFFNHAGVLTCAAQLAEADKLSLPHSRGT